MDKQQTLVVGDIQGCYSGLRRLLDKAGFEPQRDKLYAVGDLVARGEDSLATVQYLRSLGDAFSSVLGNHDLHFLAITQGIKKVKKSDRLASLLASDDLSEIIHWLRQFPLAQRLDENTVMVHAGLFPGWSSETLLSLSNEVSVMLRGENYKQLLEHMYDNGPEQWKDSVSGFARLRFVINACTRMRFIKKGLRLDFAHKEGIDSAPASLTPWFKIDNPALNSQERVIFGHWAALNGATNSTQFVGLDTGFVWGNRLTLLKLEDNQQIFIS